MRKKNVRQERTSFLKKYRIRAGEIPLCAMPPRLLQQWISSSAGQRALLASIAQAATVSERLRRSREIPLDEWRKPIDI